MILNFKEKRQYICNYMDGKKEKIFKFFPGDNKVPNSEVKALCEHPGIKRRFDLGLLVEKQSMTEDLKGEAEKVSKDKKAEQAKKAK